MLFFQLLVNGLAAGCASALVALGFGLVYNTTRIFHLAHGATYVVAAYSFYSGIVVWQLPLAAAASLTIITASGFGILTDVILYRPLDRRGASPLVQLLSSLGLYIVTVNLVALIYGNQTKVLSTVIHQPLHLGAVIISQVQLAAVLVFVVLFGALAVALRRSSWGRRLRAMRDDPELVAATGIDPMAIRTVVFGAGSALAAAAAILLGLDVGVDPHVGLTAVLNAAVAVIIGGVGRFEGAALGALLLGLLQGLVVWQLFKPLAGSHRFPPPRPLPALASGGVARVAEANRGGSDMNYLLHIFVMINVYAVLAWSLNLLVGYTGLLSLCHAAFYGIGAYVTALAMVDLGVGFWLALLLAAASTTLLSFMISLPSLRLKGDYFVLSSLAFQVIVFTILSNWMGVTRGPYGITGIPQPEVFGATIRTLPAFALFTGGVAAACGGLLYLVGNSPYGRALKVIREDELVAAVLGKNVIRFKVSAFAVAAGFAAVSGALFATYLRYIDPTSFTITESVFILSILIIGGAGNLKGPLAGAVLMLLLPEVLRFLGLPESVAANLRQVIYGLLLILLLRLRPQGLLGEYRFA